jgi:hypothetical protein
MRGYDNYNI